MLRDKEDMYKFPEQSGLLCNNKEKCELSLKFIFLKNITNPLTFRASFAIIFEYASRTEQVLKAQATLTRRDWIEEVTICMQ